MNITLEQKIKIPITRNPLMHSFCCLAETLFTSESERINKTIGNTPDEKHARVVSQDGGYKCIHLGCDQFLDKLEEVLEKEGIEINYDVYSSSKTEKIKFLDVGCGIGQKVFLAKNVFKLDAYGLELREPFILRANEIINYNKYGYGSENENRIFQENALTYDKYNQFNIIYFYCPIHNMNLQIQLEKKIAQDCKKGTILIPFLSQFFPNNNEPNNYYSKEKERMSFLTKLGWKHLGVHYYKKIK